MKIADLVKPKEGQDPLRCSCGYYVRAVVICLDPFVLASESGDTRWQSTVKKENFTVVGEASTEAFNSAIRRLDN